MVNIPKLIQKALSDAIEREEALRGPAAAQVSGVCEIRQTPEQSDRASRAVNAISLADFCLQTIHRADEILNHGTDPCAIEDLVAFPTKAHILAAAGSPISPEATDWDGADDTVMVRISGLSMSPLLNDGDVIPMRHKKSSRNPFMKKGLIYLVAYDDGYTVKPYNTRPAPPEEKGEEWVERGKIKVLESTNPDFPEIIIKQPLEWVAWLDR